MKAKKTIRSSFIKLPLLLAGAVFAAWLACPGGSARAAGWDDRNAAYNASVRGEYAEAVKLATRALKSGKLTDLQVARTLQVRLEVYFLLGNRKAGLADAKRALEICDRLIRKGHLSNWELGIAYNTRAATNQQMHRNAKAIADYTASINADPQKAEYALFNRGQLYLNLRRYELAAADVTTMLKRKLNDTQKGLALYNRARISFYLGKYDKALADYDRGLPISGGQRWLFLMGRGNVRYATGDYPGAIADYRQSIALHPSAIARTNINKARKALRSGGASREAAETAVWDSLLKAQPPSR